MTDAATKHREDVLHYLRGTIRRGEEQMATFREKLAKDPAYAMEWAHQYFRPAAALKVCGQMLAILEERPDVTLEQVRDELRRQVMRTARHPSYSTSPTGNMFALEENAAKAELLEEIEMGLNLRS